MAKRGKGGRPRLTGDRTGSGQLSRSADAVEGRESVEQRAQRKAHRYVLLGDAGQGVDLSDPIQVLAAIGHISAEEASAASEVAHLHHVLFGVPWPRTSGNEPQGASTSLRAREEEVYGKAMALVAACGTGAARVVRFICAGREMPAWVLQKPAMTVHPSTGQTVGARDIDRALLRAMESELPALRKALARLVLAGIVTAKKGGA